MRSFPFDSDVTYDSDGSPEYDRGIDSTILADFIHLMFTDGVFPNPSTGLQVTASNGEMSVVVKPGSIMIKGRMGIEENDRMLAFNAAGTHYDRIDAVVARLNVNHDYRDIDLYVVKGTEAVAPVAPSLTRSGGIYELRLANIFIAKNTSTISADRITDTRLNTDDCGIVVANPVNVDTTAIYNQYQASLDKYMEFVQDCIDGTTVANINQSISVINNRTAINLFDVNKVGFVRCTGSISGNKITGTVTSTAEYAYTALGLTTLKKNTCYTLSYKSSRPGDYGGGYQILGWKDNVTKTIAASLNAINGSVTFNTGSDGDYDKIQINLVFAVKNQPVIGDTASFWDITLVEGTQPAEYVPYVGNYNTIVDYVADVTDVTPKTVLAYANNNFSSGEQTIQSISVESGTYFLGMDACGFADALTQDFSLHIWDADSESGSIYTSTPSGHEHANCFAVVNFTEKAQVDFVLYSTHASNRLTNARVSCIAVKLN